VSLKKGIKFKRFHHPAPMDIDLLAHVGWHSNFLALQQKAQFNRNPVVRPLTSHQQLFGVSVISFKVGLYRTRPRKRFAALV